MRTTSEIVAGMTATIELAKAEARALSDAEVITYEAAEAELKGVQKTDELAARLVAYKTPIVGVPALIKATPKGDAALDFAFDCYLRTGQPNADITALRFAQTEGSTTGGGFTVPDGFRAKLTERQVAYGGLMNAAEQLVTTDGRPLPWPTVDDTAATAADVVAEGASSAAGADLTFGEKTVNAYRYAATGTGNIPLKVSVELLQDAAFDIGAFVARALANRLNRKFAVDILQANGSSKPEGLMYGTAGTIEANLGTTSASLSNLVHKLDPAYRPTASWIMNDATAARIEGLLDANNRPLLVNSTLGLESTIARTTLLGYPVIIDQACFDWTGDNVIGIAFGDLRQAYLVRKVKDVQVLVNPYTQPGYIVYDAWMRADGVIQNAWAYVTGEATS